MMGFVDLRSKGLGGERKRGEKWTGRWSLKLKNMDLDHYIGTIV
jgi:hypothetical protein